MPETDPLGLPGRLAQDVAAHAAATTRPTSFLHERWGAADVERWAAELRPRLIDLLHYAPPPVDPAPETLAHDEYGDHVRERLTFATSPWSRVPCDLLIPRRPRGGKWPAPAVVAIHCHSGVYRWGREKIVEPPDGVTDHPFLTSFRERAYGGRGYANELARRGYVVAVIDGYYFGERGLAYPHGAWPEPYRAEEAALEPDSEPWLALLNRAHREQQGRVAGALFQSGATWPGVHVWDDRKTIDLLQSRPEVDPARIGTVGLSVGGYRAAHLVATDERIKAAAVVGWMCSFAELWPVSAWPNSVGWMHYVPGLFPELDLPDVALLACPRPLLVIQGSQDRLFPLEGVKRTLAHIHTGYDKANAAERHASTIYDAPHRFDREMQEEAFTWLDRWL